MKIAVTSRGDTMDSPVDPRFGRAASFIIFDTDTQAFEARDNSQNLNAMQGAGIQAARNVSEFGAEVVITGHCGPKAFRALQAANVKVVVGADGTVAEMIDKLQSGELAPTDSADVEGHWG